MNWLLLTGFVIAGLATGGAQYFLVFKDAPLWVRIPPSVISGGIYLFLGIFLAL